MRVLVAGASGVIGRRLVPRLVERGHEVVGTSRRPETARALCELGAAAVVMDGLDAASVGEAVARAEPEVIVHQMSSLAAVRDLRRFDAGFALTNELRTRGTGHLLAAADALGIRRVVAQSFTGWPNERTGGPVKTESDPLDPDPPARQRYSIESIRYLERTVVGAAPIEGLVLRYGSLYGPETSMAEQYAELIRARKLPVVGSGRGIWSFLHVDDAAAATVLAVEHGDPGVYNVVDDDPAPVSEWLPYLAAQLGAPPPRQVPAWLARIAIGEVGVSLMTRVRGSSNAKAKRELGWRPRWSSWREGFRDGLVQVPCPGPGATPLVRISES
jgi:nucleoside-diphosphate-sugar epimerase